MDFSLNKIFGVTGLGLAYFFIFQPLFGNEFEHSNVIIYLLGSITFGVFKIIDVLEDSNSKKVNSSTDVDDETKTTG